MEGRKGGEGRDGGVREGEGRGGKRGVKEGECEGRGVQ